MHSLRKIKFRVLRRPYNPFIANYAKIADFMISHETSQIGFLIDSYF